MAQILKDEFRDKIIEVASLEFLQKGYKDASMRNIADKAGMTVGNLYRYFNNKEDILFQIVSETMNEIDVLLKDLSHDKVTMETRVFNMKANINELSELLDEFSYRLVDIYVKHDVEFNILMLHSDLKKKMTKWFSYAINSLIEQHYLLQGYTKEKQILSDAYAISIYAGIKQIFVRNSIDKDTLNRIISTYLHSYIFLLESDISRLSHKKS